MSFFYPQASMTLRILWEDFGQVSGPFPVSDNRLNSLNRIHTLSIVARRVSVNINDYSQADTFDAEIDYKQFPFDPRCLRACGVTIAMENMGKLYEGNNQLVAIQPSRTNTIFQGFADEESLTFNDSKRTVKMEGRDFTSLLVDRPYLGGPLDIGASIDVIFTRMLAELKETAELKLDNRVPGTLPILSTYAEEFTKLGSKRNTSHNETYWDLIQKLARDSGLIAYIELDRLVLSKPRVLYDEKQAKKFVYGRNVKNLEFKRKLGRRRNFNVLVRSLATVDKEKKPIKAEIPKEATAEWSKETGIANQQVMLPVVNADGSKGEAKVAPHISFVVTATSHERLIEIGQEIYETLGRQQIEGSFETKDMETTTFEKTCFNILQMRNGTPVSIELEQGDLQGLKRLGSVGERAKFLRERCYSPEVATVFAETLGKFSSVFYTKGVQFTLDQDNGFTAKVDFLNFIQVPKELGGG